MNIKELEQRIDRERSATAVLHGCDHPAYICLECEELDEIIQLAVDASSHREFLQNLIFNNDLDLDTLMELIVERFEELDG